MKLRGTFGEICVVVMVVCVLMQAAMVASHKILFIFSGRH